MHITTREAGDVRVLTVRARRIDSAASIEFKDAVRVATRDGPPRIVLDLGCVEFIDSSGLGAVVAAMKLLAPDRQLEIAALQPNVDRVFRLTRMDTVFVIHPDAEALAHAA